jgi:hypothetical protein
MWGRKIRPRRLSAIFLPGIFLLPPIFERIPAGAVSIAIGMLLPLLIYLFKQDTMATQKLLRIITLFIGIGGGTGLLFLLTGLWRLNKAVKRRSEPDELPAPARRIPGAPDTAELPPASIQHPVTEATTNLLPHEAKRAN